MPKLYSKRKSIGLLWNQMTRFIVRRLDVSFPPRCLMAVSRTIVKPFINGGSIPVLIQIANTLDIHRQMLTNIENCTTEFLIQFLSTSVPTRIVSHLLRELVCSKLIWIFTETNSKIVNFVNFDILISTITKIISAIISEFVITSVINVIKRLCQQSSWLFIINLTKVSNTLAHSVRNQLYSTQNKRLRNILEKLLQMFRSIRTGVLLNNIS